MVVERQNRRFVGAVRKEPHWNSVRLKNPRLLPVVKYSEKVAGIVICKDIESQVVAPQKGRGEPNIASSLNECAIDIARQCCDALRFICVGLLEQIMRPGSEYILYLNRDRVSLRSPAGDVRQQEHHARICRHTVEEVPSAAGRVVSSLKIEALDVWQVDWLGRWG